MAASTITDFPIPVSTPVATPGRVQLNRRRRITPQAGHALEILGHAIEYLTDEFVHNGAGISPMNGQLEAVQLLMAVNRQIYYECPELLSIGDRLRAALHLYAA